MYLLDRAASTEVMTFYRADPSDREGFESLLRERAEFMEVGFGQVLLFWSGLFHGSVINDESQTRLSLNTRYKSLFAPLGLKDPFRYFTVLRMSALTRLGLDFQRTETFAAVDAAPGRHHDQ
jgi:ectoine hydroxylase-related dioxygenase (phytanoyl-CoA dioxygenase family)